jgi:glycosyltransferase involved in cell wall biosynthesis
MKVALFTDADVFAGTERHIFDLAGALRQQGVDVRVACPQPSALATRISAIGIEVLAIPKKGMIDFAAAKKLKGLLRDRKLDIIHAHNGRTAISAAMAVSGAKVGACVFTQHFLEPGQDTRKGVKALISKKIHGWKNRRIDEFIAISDAVRQSMLQRGEATLDKITLVPNGIPTPDKSKLKPAADIRRELNIAADAPLIVCAARLQPEKDVPTLVSAMASLVKTSPGAVCVIAGEGPQFAMISMQIEDAGLQKNVRLLGFREDAISLMNAGDVFVLPSLAEPFGLVLLEAMSLAKPVIATRAGGPLEIVFENQTGLLVRPAEPGQLCDAIQKLITDPAAAKRFGENGFTRFEERFTAARMAKATVGVYEKSLAAEVQPPLEAVQTQNRRESLTAVKG